MFCNLFKLEQFRSGVEIPTIFYELKTFGNLKYFAIVEDEHGLSLSESVYQSFGVTPTFNARRFREVTDLIESFVENDADDYDVFLFTDYLYIGTAHDDPQMSYYVVAIGDTNATEKMLQILSLINKGESVNGKSD